MASRRRKKIPDPNDDTGERLARVEERVESIEKRQDEHYDRLHKDLQSVLRKVDWLTVEANKSKLQRELPGLPPVETPGEGDIIVPAKTVRTLSGLARKHGWVAIIGLLGGTLSTFGEKLVKWLAGH